MTRIRSLTLAVLALALLAAPIAADALADAKAAGQIGERVDGYVGVVTKDAPASTTALVAQVNAERLARYQAIARENGTPVEFVAQRAGALLVQRTPAGQYVMDPSGAWQKR